MDNVQVINTLEAKRTELLDRLDDLERQQAAIKADVQHIERTMELLGLTIRYGEKRPPEARFKRREIADYLREIDRDCTMTCRQIALEVMDRKGLDRDDRRLVGFVMESVKSGRKYRKRRLGLI